MAYVYNGLSHGVRQGGVRVPPGQIGQVSDEVAAALTESDGVDKSTKKAYEEQEAARPNLAPGSPKLDLEKGLKAHRHAHRHDSVVHALNQEHPDPFQDTGQGATGPVVTAKVESDSE